jgi:hypothetical protein
LSEKMFLFSLDGTVTKWIGECLMTGGELGQ